MVTITAKDSRWEDFFQRLQRYKEQHGDCLIPQRCKQDPKLGAWLNQQRQKFKRKALRADREKKLTSIGLEWSPVENGAATDSKWNKSFRKLQGFEKENGHCRVPVRYHLDPPLACWVQTQRTEFSRGNLHEHRKGRLDAIGFDYNPFENEWNAMFQKLKVFKQNHGNCLVPSGHPDLGAWVSLQRVAYHKNALYLNRKGKLESIGFVWTVGLLRKDIDAN